MLSALDERMDLEKRFVFALFGLLALSSGSYLAFAVRPTSAALVLALTVGVGAVATGVSHFLLFRPIRRLVVMAKAVGAGDFSKRLGFRRHDDIGLLALEMDAMCDQLQAAKLAAADHIAALDQLRHSDRVSTLGRLASSVAHELGNPLNVIELRAQLIASGDAATLDQAQQSARVIVEQAKRMTRIIDEILSFARMQPTKIARIELMSVLRKAIALTEHVAQKNHTRIVLASRDSSIYIDGDADKLLQIIVNLMVNGVQAMPKGGRLELSTYDELRAPLDDPDGARVHCVCVEVTDAGVGIPPHLLAKVFEPFFSTRSADGGTGLGLSVAQGIAREHEGCITVESTLGRGSSFKVHLPKGRARE